MSTFLLWEESLNVADWIKHSSFKFVSVLAIACCAAGIYYSLHGCLRHEIDKFDLLRMGDWRLVANVIALLWPVPGPACRDYLDPCGVVTGVLNGFVLIVLGAPLWLWNHPKRLTEQKKLLLVLPTH